MIKVTLKGGDVREYEAGTPAESVVKSLGAGLYKAACVVLIDGELKDIRTVLDKDCTLEVLTFDDERGRRAFNHTASHIMAQAVKRLFPDVKLTIGPAIENGFYYDFDTEKPFTPEILTKIEEEMKKIVKENLRIERFELPVDEAVKLMEEKNEPYKVELIKEHASKGEKISFYKQGEFTELCAGPHIPDTGRVKAFKLIQCTGAYWHGDSKNKMLQRVYGIAFPKASQLEEYLNMLEEAKKRDHRKIGRELDLFDIYPEGPGFPFFLPKGMVLRNTLEDFWRKEHVAHGYQEIRTPMILSEELWHRSGHWDHYKENMYFTKIDEGDYAIKPMNCPGGMLVYKRKMHSYKDLPIRMAELGLVHRHELSGTLHGLMRVRCFTQDDAHIFMTPEQIEDEIIGVIDLIDHFYKVFGFDYHVELSTRPENSMGSDEQWEMATNGLKNALERKGIEYKINEGDGAFYGPKIDFHLTDCLGRTWQCGTIQLDFQLPERFELEYTGADGQKHRPVMLHRVVFGSIERFIGILTEQYAGAFPVWLAPVQVKVLPIADRHNEYAYKVCDTLKAAGIRVEVDDRNEKIGYRIREAQLQKIPFMLVLGDKEVESGSVAVRARSEGDKGSMSLDAFLDMVKEKIDTKSLS
ncbi:Threonine-tRNA ligase [[Clostridium] cellulosi]|jgi:threonyl-tRNA synthetase (EC 6.1.1.3)/Ser-tRNA(Thr) hydrolase (EC 3.1.1.-)|uniref:Threonine--tRNA ligase n=1 Tax=[Clostridium] cellulosi TaxID=29343 RepID=A0A078KR61_9FIRM|nr:Threonine-tRNA ligase [[Clostridium] cellulosi]